MTNGRFTLVEKELDLKRKGEGTTLGSGEEFQELVHRNIEKKSS